jgi:hypothetical protein
MELAMSDQLFVILLVGAAIVVIAALLLMFRYDREAQNWRTLVERHGQERALELIAPPDDPYIDSILRRGLRNQHLLQGKVVDLVPRYRSGREMPVTPDGAA